MEEWKLIEKLHGNLGWEVIPKCYEDLSVEVIRYLAECGKSEDEIRERLSARQHSSGAVEPTTRPISASIAPPFEDDKERYTANTQTNLQQSSDERMQSVESKPKDGFIKVIRRPDR